MYYVMPAQRRTARPPGASGRSSDRRWPSCRGNLRSPNPISTNRNCHHTACLLVAIVNELTPWLTRRHTPTDPLTAAHTGGQTHDSPAPWSHRPLSHPSWRSPPPRSQGPRREGAPGAPPTPSCTTGSWWTGPASWTEGPLDPIRCSTLRKQPTLWFATCFKIGCLLFWPSSCNQRPTDWFPLLHRPFPSNPTGPTVRGVSWRFPPPAAPGPDHTAAYHPRGFADGRILPLAGGGVQT